MFKRIKNNKRKIELIVALLIILTFIIYNFYIRNTEVQALSKYGSRGSEVTTIQTKLKRWGYYTGNIDGIYGTRNIECG